jgi:hypothetical protein
MEDLLLHMYVSQVISVLIYALVEKTKCEK